MESIAALAKNCRVASGHDKVLNTECAFTFHTPYTTSKGILVDLKHWIGMIEEIALKKCTESEGHILLRIVKERQAKEKTTKNGEPSLSSSSTTTTTIPAEEDNTKKKVTTLGIGVEGGFASLEDKYQVVSTYSIVVIRDSKIIVEVPYKEEEEDKDFPMMVVQSAKAIKNHVGLTLQKDVEAWKLDQDDIPVTKYAESLEFVDNGVMISPDPKQWKCQKDPSHTENLWLNLSDGYVGGGRKHWDGSGGSNGALDHFEQTGKKYPLVVKLGTIAADLSQADCYSYAPDEDGPVKIPQDILLSLLHKRGINVSSMQKTEKSTAELEVELNATYAFDAITESGSTLRPVSGPGYQGLQNSGNSCYMNSILQLLFSGSIQELTHRYGCSTAPPSQDIYNHIFTQQTTPKQAPEDILCQTTKLACALTSGVFAKPNSNKEQEDATADPDETDPKYRLAPNMFKHVIGKDHIDFRTGQQQDTAHYLLHLLQCIDRAEKKAFNDDLLKQHLLSTSSSKQDTDQLHPTSHLFSFQTTARLLCNADGKVKYKVSAPETIWSVRLPMEKATTPTDEQSSAPEQKRHKPDEPEGTAEEDTADGKTSKEETKQVPILTFQDCLESWGAQTEIQDIRWKHLQNQPSTAKQTIRFTNFPRYLFIQTQRYTMGADWTPQKLEVHLDIPQQLDLTKYKSTGPQPNEQLIPDDDEQDDEASSQQPTSSSATVIDEAALAQLMDMGFSLHGCKRALTAVGGNDVEAAMNWVFEHNQDPDFNDPMPEQQLSGQAAASSSDGIDDAVVASLVETLGCFTADQVRAALKATNGAADRAADWLFSHMDDLDAAVASVNDQGNNNTTDTGDNSNSSKLTLEDSNDGNYTMIGMISHIGKHTGSGHYVAHIRKKDEKNNHQWVIFNDEKVAYSESPPFPHAYMYLYQRSDTMQ